MKSVNILQFLNSLGNCEDLVKSGVLQRNGQLLQLRTKSVFRLIEIMKEKGIDRLEDSMIWWLDKDGYFVNRYSSKVKYKNKMHYSEADKPGDVFDGTNKVKSMNPCIDKNQDVQIKFVNRDGEKTRDKDMPPRKESILRNQLNIFTSEDISKPENRCNLAIFHLQIIHVFHEWFMKRLGLDASHYIYPSVNEKGDRPDFIIIDSEMNKVAFIETELGTDIAQFEKYKEKFGNVKVINGRQDQGGDLSFEEISKFLEDQHIHWDMQEQISAIYLIELINNSISRVNKPRVPISKDMDKTKIIIELKKRFGEDKFLYTGNAIPGKFLLNTYGEKGFSLRVFSRQSLVDKSLSVMYQTNGRPSIGFPSEKKMNHYLPNKLESVRFYTSLLFKLGIPDISTLDETMRPTLPINIVEEHIEEFLNILEMLI